MQHPCNISIEPHDIGNETENSETSYQNEMSALRALELSRVSRGIGFYLGML